MTAKPSQGSGSRHACLLMGLDIWIRIRIRTAQSPPQSRTDAR